MNVPIPISYKGKDGYIVAFGPESTGLEDGSWDMCAVVVWKKSGRMSVMRVGQLVDNDAEVVMDGWLLHAYPNPF